MNNLALAQDADGQTQRAADIWREVLRREPGHRQAQGNLVHALCRDGAHREAAALFERQLRGAADTDASPGSITASACISCAITTAPRRASGALALAPNDALILTNLGSVLSTAAPSGWPSPFFAQAHAIDPQRLYAATLLATARAHGAGGTGRRTARAHPRARVARRPRSRRREPVHCAVDADAACSTASRRAALGARCAPRTAARHWCRPAVA
jgi:hypothetical protein